MPDVFLSYCWNDNTDTEQLDEKKQPLGWAAYLERRLAQQITMYRGLKTDVWRDATDMRGNFQLSQDVYGALDESRLLVAVLSESYLRSDWCPDEFDRFRRRVRDEPNAGEWKRRIFHLFRTPVPNPTAEIADAKHYEFFLRRSTADKDHIPFEPNPTSEFKAQFDSRVTELASDIAKELAPATAGPSAGVVYLASPSSDLQMRFIALRAELKDLNFNVRPDPSLPEGGFAEAVRAQLAQSHCCIFPIGREAVPAINGVDPVETELQLAIEACDPIQRPVLVWLPPASAESSSSLVRDLKAGKITRPGLEVRQSEFPIFKNDMLQWLKTLREKQEAMAAPTKTIPRGALIYDLCDLGDPARVRSEIILQSLPGVRLSRPDFQGNPAELRELERNQVEEAPFVLLFSGASSEEWLAAKRAVLKANPGRADRKVGIFLLDDGRPFKSKTATELGASAFLVRPNELKDETLATWLKTLL